jgi:hypothetical protein
MFNRGSHTRDDFCLKKATDALMTTQRRRRGQLRHANAKMHKSSKSRWIGEVKQRRTRLKFGWATGGEFCKLTKLAKLSLANSNAIYYLRCTKEIERSLIRRCSRALGKTKLHCKQANII